MSARTKTDNLDDNIEGIAGISNGDAITSRTFIDSWMAMLSYAREGLSMASVSLFDAVKGARNYRVIKVLPTR
jgi:hypothetical protein